MLFVMILQRQSPLGQSDKEFAVYNKIIRKSDLKNRLWKIITNGKFLELQFLETRKWNLQIHYFC